MLLPAIDWCCICCLSISETTQAPARTLPPKAALNLNVGEARTVRMNLFSCRMTRPFSPGSGIDEKDHSPDSNYLMPRQMQAQDTGTKPFALKRILPRGEPMVHHVDVKSDRHYR